MARQQSTTNHQTVQCQICKKPKRFGAVMPAELVRPPMSFSFWVCSLWSSSVALSLMLFSRAVMFSD